MPIFQYKALHEDGREAVGMLNADTPRDARERLRAQQLLVTEILQVEDPVLGARKRAFALPGRRDVGSIALVTRQLSTLLKAGIPLAESLAVLIQQVESPALERALRDVREKVLEGVPLHEALARHPRYFDSLFVSMIKAGEASGTLDLITKRLADFNQSQARVANRVKAALVYPGLIALVGIMVVIFLMSVVVPQIERVFLAQHRALPWQTQTLIAASRFVRHDWLLLLAGVAGAFLGFRAVLETDAGRLVWDRLRLRAPILGDVLRKQIIARFAATLSTLLGSGLPILEALSIVRQVVGNRVMADTVARLHDRIVEGADIATPLRESRIFPPVVSYMIAVGERSGQLEDILNTLSGAYEEEVEVATQKLLSVLEPIMIIGMALVVGYIVISIVLPIMDMVRGYQH
jgi:general secretion pathway protein F